MVKVEAGGQIGVGLNGDGVHQDRGLCKFSTMIISFKRHLLFIILINYYSQAK